MADTPAAIGEMVLARFRGDGTRRILLLAHMDTVYQRGMLSEQPFRIDRDRAYGLGIADDKHGIAVPSTNSRGRDPDCSEPLPRPSVLPVLLGWIGLDGVRIGEARIKLARRPAWRPRQASLTALSSPFARSTQHFVSAIH